MITEDNRFEQNLFAVAEESDMARVAYWASRAACCLFDMCQVNQREVDACFFIGGTKW